MPSGAPTAAAGSLVERVKARDEMAEPFEHAMAGYRSSRCADDSNARSFLQLAFCSRRSSTGYSPLRVDLGFAALADSGHLVFAYAGGTRMVAARVPKTTFWAASGMTSSVSCRLCRVEIRSCPSSMEGFSLTIPAAGYRLSRDHTS